MGVRVVFPDMGKDPSVQLIEKTITENGTYDAITDGANGYSKVNVNVEGGGGGSSDLTTATVTFNSNTDVTLQVMVPVATEDGADIERAVRKGRTLEVLLYNGSCIVSPNDSFKGDFTDFSATGDISIDTEAGNIIVSGDGTISYNAK